MTAHKLLINAFRSISDKNALAWSVLDTKSELFVWSAIALAANCEAASRIAYVEYPRRVDLVFKDKNGRVADAHSAKAGYVSDFQPRRIAIAYRYLGAHLDADIAKSPPLCARLGAEVQGAGIFYLYEVSEPSKQTKYADKVVDVELAIAALVRFVPRGT